MPSNASAIKWMTNIHSTRVLGSSTPQPTTKHVSYYSLWVRDSQNAAQESIISTVSQPWSRSRVKFNKNFVFCRSRSHNGNIFRPRTMPFNEKLNIYALPSGRCRRLFELCTDADPYTGDDAQAIHKYIENTACVRALAWLRSGGTTFWPLTGWIDLGLYF